MRVIGSSKESNFMSERFDANHGMSNIKLDNCTALGGIRAKKNLYLKEQRSDRSSRLIIEKEQQEIHPPRGSGSSKSRYSRWDLNMMVKYRSRVQYSLSKPYRGYVVLLPPK